MKYVVIELREQNDELKLTVMNHERAQLELAECVSIGVAEQTYLTEKWNLNNFMLNYIELARKETLSKYFDFKHRIVDCT